jgi:ABC-2 type transport system permease protein
MCFAVIIALLLASLGTLISGHILSLYELGKLLLVVIGGCIPFASLGLLLGLIMAPNAAPGVINLFYLPLSFCGGLWMPIEMLPQWLQHVAHVLPSYYFSRLALHALGYSAVSALVERAGGLYRGAACPVHADLPTQRGTRLSTILAGVRLHCSADNPGLR